MKHGGGAMDGSARSDGRVRDGGGGVRVVPEVAEHPFGPFTVSHYLGAIRDNPELTWKSYLDHIADTFAPLGATGGGAPDGDGCPDRDPDPDDRADRDRARAALVRGLDAERQRRGVRVGHGDGGGDADPADVPDAAALRHVPLRPGADE
jgi:hypothetical protein